MFVFRDQVFIYFLAHFPLNLMFCFFSCLIVLHQGRSDLCPVGGFNCWSQGSKPRKSKP